MKKWFTILIYLFVAACAKEDEKISTSIPTCIQNIINDEELSKTLKTVQVQELRGELHYWLNTDFRHFDGVEYIVNNKCDTICSFCGECIPAECSFDYNQDWIKIWEK